MAFGVRVTGRSGGAGVGRVGGPHIVKRELPPGKSRLLAALVRAGGRPSARYLGAVAAQLNVLPTRRLRVRTQHLLMALLVATGACATTKTTSMVAPEARGKVFMRVLVVADIQDLAMMQYAERAVRSMPPSPTAPPDTIVCDPICRRIAEFEKPSSDSTVFIPAHTVLFPGRTYSADELRRILREHGIDATLVVSPTAAGVSETYVPPTMVTSCTTWSSTTSCSSRAVGGGTLKSPWASYAARMYDASTGEVVWIATSSTNGSFLSDASSLISSMAAETVRKLRGDRLIM